MKVTQERSHEGWDCLSLLELRSSHYEARIPDKELQGLVFSLLDFDLVLVSLFLLHPSTLEWELEILEVCNLPHDFTRSHS